MASREEYISGNIIFHSGRNAAVGGTAAALSSNTPCVEVVLQAAPGNGASVLVGDATRQDYELVAGASVTLPVANLSLIYVKSAAGTVAVNWLYRG